MLSNIYRQSLIAHPGILASISVAVVAVFLNEHYGAPAMLFALLLGLSFKFLSEEGPCVSGITLSSTTILRFGVALLGFRITGEQIVALGPSAILFVIAYVTIILMLGLMLARFFDLDWRLGLITGGAVGICGAAAAMTISALLPKNEETTRWTLFTVVGVTSLSTLAMIIYPILTKFLSLNPQETGFFLGATIHDVAQVMGASYAVSDIVGNTAALTKMMRVAMLAPASFAIALALTRHAGAAVSLKKSLPWFVVLFAIFAAFNSFGFVSIQLGEFLSAASRWCLIIGIAAMGMRTSFKEVLSIGPRAIALLCIETVVLGLIVLLCIQFSR